MVIDEREGREQREEKKGKGALMIAREGDEAKTNVVAVCQESSEKFMRSLEKEKVLPASALSLSLPFSLSLSLSAARSLLVIVICCCQS